MKNQDPPLDILKPLVTLFNNGKLKQSLSESSQMLERFPNSIFLCNISGASSAGLKQFDAAIKYYKKALEIKPDYAEAYYNMGIALKDNGDLDAAIDSYKKALEIKPDYVGAYFNTGNILKDTGDLEAAIDSYKKALEIKPDYAEAYNNIGLILKDKGDLEEAINSYKKALEMKPDYAEAYNNIGIVLQEISDLVSAIENYEIAIKIKPDFADAYYNLGNAHKENSNLKKAISSYKMTLDIQPNSSDAYLNMGIALNNLGDLEAAIICYKNTLKINPSYTEAYFNMAIALKSQGNLEVALDNFKQALKINTNYAPALSQSHYLASIMSNWSYAKTLEQYLSSDLLDGNLSIYGLLSFEDNPLMHLERASNLVKSQYKLLPLFNGKSVLKSNRIKIGYFSSYFRQHPVTMLSVKMLECSDREKFEIFAFHYGPIVNDEYNLRINAAFDHFINVSEMSDKEIASLALENSIDIAIEFNGFMKDERIGILAHRPSPIQINYLAYPGTMGADFYDYIVADETLIPEDQKSNYAENIIYLPSCYMPQDNSRQISDKPLTRQDFNLPEDGFVFCCFNNSFKITPKEFDIWMRLLSKVDGSVLWLLKANKSSVENLKSEAEKRGVKADRLIFADKLAIEEHLARQRLADLFLDTFNFNAHTTASDALWVGLPVVTKIGKGFAARVAGSLLTSIEVPELITTSEKEYEALALDLATNPEKLSLIKKKLADKRSTAPLFDTETYTKNLEKAYTKAYERYSSGLPPAEIIIL